jgi:hypothetical protein
MKTMLVFATLVATLFTINPAFALDCSQGAMEGYLSAGRSDLYGACEKQNAGGGGKAAPATAPATADPKPSVKRRPRPTPTPQQPAPPPPVAQAPQPATPPAPQPAPPPPPVVQAPQPPTTTTTAIVEEAKAQLNAQLSAFGESMQTQLKALADAKAAVKNFEAATQDFKAKTEAWEKDKNTLLDNMKTQRTWTIWFLIITGSVLLLVVIGVALAFKMLRAARRQEIVNETFQDNLVTILTRKGLITQEDILNPGPG